MTLNVDLGELEDEPHELYRLATQVNLACGGHAGSVQSMDRALAEAAAAGARIAAHPSYPDRAGFGRTSLPIAPAALGAAVEEQCRSLRTLAEARGLPLRTVKPHGALYHDLGRDPALAEAFLDGVTRALGDGRGGLAIVGPPGSAFRAQVRARRLDWIDEGFADRGYAADGSLLPRSAPGALLDSPEAAARQALALAPQVATLCVHGDTPGAVVIARAVREALERAGVLE